jgi:LL-diaminopimelate aminotransferase
MIEVSNRLNGIGEYYFATKLREIDALNKAGQKVINLGIGSPDLPPHPSVIEMLHQEASKDNTHAYQSYKGSPILRNAIAGWYKKAYGVAIDPDSEVLPLIGSKEGIMHICMTYLDKGDAALAIQPTALQ